MPSRGRASTELIDQQGNTVIRNNYELTRGINRITIWGTRILPTGLYSLRVNVNGVIIQKTVVKQNN
jgi:hypothetical protein